MFFSGDFETTTCEPTSVWLFGLMDIMDFNYFIYGKSIREFFKYCYDTGNHTIFFKNLKFDGNFIISHLLINGYTWCENKEKCTDRTFTTIIDSSGKFFSMTIYFKKSKNGKHTRKLTIYNSSNFFPNLSVEDIAENFNLPIKKGLIDYDRHNIECEITKKEIEYIKNDCQIMAYALRTIIDLDMTSVTIGANAVKDLKSILGEKKFRAFFPTLTYDSDTKIRTAYKGGYNYLNPNYADKNIKIGISLDVNAMYANIMYNEYLPYGVPLEFDGEYKFNSYYPLYIQKLRCILKIKKNHLPTIQVKHIIEDFCPTEYILNSENKIITLSLTNIDLRLLKKHYDVEIIDYLGGYMFKAKKNIFKEYIDKWNSIKIKAKTNQDKVLYFTSKLMLNQLTGKFAKKPILINQQPYLKNGKVKFTRTSPKLTDSFYTAMAVFITSYGRNRIITAAQKIHFDSIKKTGKSRFIYANTDSLHLIGDEIPEFIDINSSELGKWKYEGMFYKARFLRPNQYIRYMFIKECKEKNQNVKVINYKEKKYIVQNENTIFPPTITCSGMSKKCYEHVTWKNFTHGTSYPGNLRPKTVKGGILLLPEDFTIL